MLRAHDVCIYFSTSGLAGASGGMGHRRWLSEQRAVPRVRGRRGGKHDNNDAGAAGAAPSTAATAWHARTSAG
ncbi:unnamed protein product [Ectocarpus sp. 12 AP-2014]